MNHSVDWRDLVFSWYTVDDLDSESLQYLGPMKLDMDTEQTSISFAKDFPLNVREWEGASITLTDTDCETSFVPSSACSQAVTQALAESKEAKKLEAPMGMQS